MKNWTFIVPSSVNQKKIYVNAFLSKSEIYKDFQDIAIIYMWFNKITGKIYIGRSLKGSKRLSEYYKKSVLNRCENSLIYSEMLEYGPNNFSLIILEQFSFPNILTKEERCEILNTIEIIYIVWAILTYGSSRVLNKKHNNVIL